MPQHPSHFDPDLPNASAVLASLCCVAARYASHPSVALARLASDLAHQLMAPHYAESELMIEVAKRLASQWDAILHEQHLTLASLQPSSSTKH
jgi:hypothetical protein